LKSDQAKSASSERTAQGAINAIKRTEHTLDKTYDEIVKQGRTVDGFTLFTVFFLPLGFSTSVFYFLSAIQALSDKGPHQYYGMQTIEDDNNKLTLNEFWLITGCMVAVITVLAALVITWNRSFTVKLRHRLGRALLWPLTKMIKYPKMHAPQGQAATRPNSQEQALPF